MTVSNELMEELREEVAEVLEIEPDELVDGADFIDVYEADSLRSIEILSRVEKRYRVEIPQAELAQMRTLTAVHDVVARYVAD